MEPPVPAQIEVDRDQAVTITWVDGRRDEFPIAELRANCPCATCRGEREQGKVPGGGADTPIADAELVGNWGLGVMWADGHSTGIYPWELLRAWAETSSAAPGDS